jgi:NTE family protein
LYAAGKNGAEIERIYQSLFESSGNFWKDLFTKDERSIKWYDLLSPGFKGQSGMFHIDEFLDFLIKQIQVERIEQLPIPVRIVAADFWRREAVVFDEGDIRTAIKASVSLPGIFSPVQFEDRILVDGGAVNPVPFDLLDSDCEITIAINVLGEKQPKEDELMPSLFEALFNTYQIMEESIVQEKLKQHRPSVYLKPDIQDVRVLDFYKYPEVCAQCETMLEQLEATLEPLLQD